MAEHSVQHVVVDSGGFIKNAPLKDMAGKIYSIQEVVSEIRDKPTRQRLQVLPYEIIFREPSTEAIRLVTEFSKKTGDYRTLSAVDIKVMALTYQLEKEVCGTDHLRSEPQTKGDWTTSKKHLEKPTEIAGFYLKKKGDGDASSTTSRAASRTTSVCQPDEEITSHLQATRLEDTPEQLEKSNNSSDLSGDNSRTVQLNIVDTEQNIPENDSLCINKDAKTELRPSLDVDQDVNEQNSENSDSKEDNNSERRVDGETLPSTLIAEDYEESSEEEEEEESEEEDGWITPGNIAAVKKSMGHADMEESVVEVGCLTLDFSMQNVLIQMGLNVISVDGMLIRRAKSYVQRCSACMKICTNMEKAFCPTCGNPTLQRIAMTVHDDGSIQYFVSRRKPANLRGLRHSLPNPKGGKYHTNPILCEDQPQAQHRLSKKAKVKYNVFEAGYIAHNSPFAPVDTQSRSAQLGFGVRKNRKNPNENKKVYGRRK